jgi:hypothetical protein
MATSTLRSRSGSWTSVRNLIQRHPIRQRTIIGGIIIGALLAFELFNYSTTEFALTDLLGDLQFVGVRWATILALAFCSMDFAGIARLFTQDRALEQPTETWYLLGAWFLAATMNAMLSWWAVSLALLGHQGLGNEVIGRDALLTGVPIFVALLVWLIRVLIIGTFTLTGERLFQGSDRSPVQARRSDPARPRPKSRSNGQPAPVAASLRPSPKPIPRRDPRGTSHVTAREQRRR